MESHAIIVFLNVFFESAGLCQNPRVYADAGACEMVFRGFLLDLAKKYRRSVDIFLPGKPKTSKSQERAMQSMF